MKRNLEIKELRVKDKKELYQEINKLENKIAELKFKASFRKLKNYQEISETRKKIARIWTILAEKALGELISEANQKVGK